jgi:pimeloyl-ACP methyl ester carboxylesterase
MENKETRSLPVPKYIQWGMRNLERISPALATRVSLFLFFRPLRFNIPEREKNFRAEGSVSWKRTEHGRQIKVFEYGGPSERKLLFFHGWSGRSSQFYKIIPNLIKLGFEVHAPDAPGHGESSGNKASLLEFQHLLEQMWRENGPYYGFVGHSLGGIASMIAAQGFAVEAVCIIGTPASIFDIFHDFCAQLHLSAGIRDRMIKKLEKQYELGIEDLAPINTGKRIKARGLIVHDENDVDVPVSAAFRIHKEWLSSKTFITSGLGHRRILSQKEVVGQIAHFFSENK